MHEQRTQRLEGSPTVSRLAPHAAGLVPVRDRRSSGRQRRGGQPMEETCPRRGPGGPPAASTLRCSPPADRRPTGAVARALAPGGRSLWLSGTGLDLWPDRRGDSPGIWQLLPSRPCGPLVPSNWLEPAKACPARPPARRSRHCALAGRHVASPQKGAQAQQQTIYFIDESGFYPLPSVVRTYAPGGHTPILRGWWTRDHLSAISAISPEGKL
jgi:hypothetical protein